MFDDGLLKFKEDCFKEIEDKQASLIIKYNLGKYDEYFCDQSAKIIQFKKNGRIKLEFIFIPVGSLSDSDIWTWAWADKSITEELRLQSIKLKELAEITNINLFKLESFKVQDENLIHDITAMTVHHLNAMGMYIAQTGEEELFLALMKKV